MKLIVKLFSWTLILNPKINGNSIKQSIELGHIKQSVDWERHIKLEELGIWKLFVRENITIIEQNIYDVKLNERTILLLEKLKAYMNDRYLISDMRIFWYLISDIWYANILIREYSDICDLRFKSQWLNK